MSGCGTGVVRSYAGAGRDGELAAVVDLNDKSECGRRMESEGYRSRTQEGSNSERAYRIARDEDRPCWENDWCAATKNSSCADNFSRQEHKTMLFLRSVRPHISSVQCDNRHREKEGNLATLRTVFRLSEEGTRGEKLHGQVVFPM